MATATRRISRDAPDSYMKLVRRFPLRPLKNDDEHERAVNVIGELMGRDLDAGAGDYLDTLILLVNKYEDERHTPDGVHLTPRQAVRAIMNANGMTQADMGKIIGSESAVSMFLKGERELSKAHIRALAERFKVSTDLFMG
ncbi:MAG: helix-turn-helix domain-containing protein [Tepidisphaeraceae bacterium]|jgi:HTH-type transcriptional regulator/antitoxin HigA